MFGIIADFLSSVFTILLPAYLSYKALRTSDPGQTKPWLIYFIILSLALLAESWTLFIIGWMPFYSWIRLFFLLYLVLPQTQGAKVLYLNYMEPFIVQHERDIDVFIGETHQRLEQMGMGYFNVVIDWLREKALGQKPQGPTQAAGVSVGGYAQNLLSRFAMPSASTNAAGAASNMYGMLSGVAGVAMSGAAGRSRGLSAEYAPSANEPLIPDSMLHHSAEEKSYYLTQQRERLSNMMRALDKEQQNLDLAYGDRVERSRSRPSSSGSNLGVGLGSKSKSEASFEQVSYDDIQNGSQLHAPPGKHTQANQGGRRTPSGNWMPTGVTSWFGSGGSAAATPDEKPSSRGWSAAMEVTEAVQGMSSSIDHGR